MELRTAGAADLPFLWKMLACAVDWRDRTPPGTVDGPARRYLERWGRKGDVGIVAVERDQLVGAAWVRLFPESEPGYGFVAADIPELTIAVEPSFRRRGVGRQLLEALTETAHAAGYRALSLSVEPDNPACSLYEQVGFERVTESDAVTMLLPLS